MNLSKWLTIFLAIELFEQTYGKRAKKNLNSQMSKLGGFSGDCESKEEFNECKAECDDNRDCTDVANLNCGAQCKAACKVVTQEKAECESVLISYISKWRGRIAWDEDDDIPKRWPESKSYYPSYGSSGGEKKKHSKKRHHKGGGGKKHHKKKKHHGGGGDDDDDDDDKDDDDDDKKDKDSEKGIDKYGPSSGGGGSGSGSGNRSPFDSSKFSQGDAQSAGTAEEEPKKKSKLMGTLGKVRDTVRWAQSPLQKTVGNVGEFLKDERNPIRGISHSNAAKAVGDNVNRGVSRFTGRDDSGGGSSDSGGSSGGSSSGSSQSSSSSGGSSESGGSSRRGGLLGGVGRGLGSVARGVGGVLG